MLVQVWSALLGYLGIKADAGPWQRVAAIGTLYATAVTLAYEYLAWRFNSSPPLSLFVHSYLFKQVSIAVVAVVGLAWVLSPAPPAPPASGPLARLTALPRRLRSVRIVAIALILALAGALTLRLQPAQVSTIRVKFLDEPDEAFDKYAFVYTIYELNRLQKSWYFEVDFDTVKPSDLTSVDRERCAGRPLCVAELLAQDSEGAPRPFIGITSGALGGDTFWQNDGTTSVISVDGWSRYAPPSVYEYLDYAVIMQSVLIHLNGQCGGLPKGAFARSRVGHGGLFQFAPRRRAMKAEVLAASVEPHDQELLLNCFGVDFLTTSSSLLTLDWLHSKEVSGNLRRAFDVTLDGPEHSEAAPAASTAGSKPGG